MRRIAHVGLVVWSVRVREELLNEEGEEGVVARSEDGEDLLARTQLRNLLRVVEPT